MDQELQDDVLTFAPRPQQATFYIAGEKVTAGLWNFMDLPSKHSLRVYELEGQLSGEYAGQIDKLQEIVGLLCPTLTPEQRESLSPNQMMAAVAASHGVTERPPVAAPAAAPSSPSGSAESSESSPTAEGGTPSA